MKRRKGYAFGRGRNEKGRFYSAIIATLVAALVATAIAAILASRIAVLIPMTTRS